MSRHRTAVERETYEINRRARARMANFWCEANGMHHELCPGEYTASSPGAFVVHHVQPRAKGGSDDIENLRWVWNGFTGLGAGGCHGRIHQRRGQAHELGLLAS